MFVFALLRQDPKILDKVTKKNGTNIPELDKRSLTICSNTDYINITYHHVICPDAATAKVSNVLIGGIRLRPEAEMTGIIGGEDLLHMSVICISLNSQLSPAFHVHFLSALKMSILPQLWVFFGSFGKE